MNLTKLFTNNPVVNIVIDKVNYKMMLDMKDEGISIDLFIGRLREYPNVLYFKKFLKEFGKKIDSIVEIGANIGFYVGYEDAIFKQLLNKKPHIYAIEPVSRNLYLLKINTDLNNISNIDIIHGAVGEKDQKINVIIPPQGNFTQIEGISGNERYSSNSLKEEVDMYSLKKLFAQYKIPKKNLLFRCDIEGYEYNLIKGNYKIFKELQNVQFIMEFHGFFLHEKKAVELLKMLKELGFKLKYAVCCYPPYFTKMPRPVKWFVIKTWLMEHNGTNLGLLPEYKSIDDLIKGFQITGGPLYEYPGLHFYLVKN